MEPPLSVMVETLADGVYASCPELDIHSSGYDEASALDRLSEMISEYWATLLQDLSLRENSPHREHYELFVQKVIPFIHEQEQTEHTAKSAGFREHVAGIMRTVSGTR